MAVIDGDIARAGELYAIYKEIYPEREIEDG